MCVWKRNAQFFHWFLFFVWMWMATARRSISICSLSRMKLIFIVMIFHAHNLGGSAIVGRARKCIHAVSLVAVRICVRGSRANEMNGKRKSKNCWVKREEEEEEVRIKRDETRRTLIKIGTRMFHLIATTITAQPRRNGEERRKKEEEKKTFFARPITATN